MVTHRLVSVVLLLLMTKSQPEMRYAEVTSSVFSSK